MCALKSFVLKRTLPCFESLPSRFSYNWILVLFTKKKFVWNSNLISFLNSINNLWTGKLLRYGESYSMLPLVVWKQVTKRNVDYSAFVLIMPDVAHWNNYPFVTIRNSLKWCYYPETSNHLNLTRDQFINYILFRLRKFIMWFIESVNLDPVR
jgi:hypothetical protein